MRVELCRDCLRDLVERLKPEFEFSEYDGIKFPDRPKCKNNSEIYVITTHRWLNGYKVDYKIGIRCTTMNIVRKHLNNFITSNLPQNKHFIKTSHPI